MNPIKQEQGRRVPNNLSKYSCLLVFVDNPNLSETDMSRHGFRKRLIDEHQTICVEYICVSYLSIDIN